MITSIRMNQWETNSSSVHQLVIKGGNCVVPKSVSIYGGEYGWGHDVLKTTNEKLSYVFTNLYYLSSKEEFDEVYEELKQFLYDSGVKEIGDPDFKDRPEDSWSCCKFYDMKGYVDHQSLGTGNFVSMIKNHSGDLYTLLFDPTSYITIGNDNDCAYYDEDADKWVEDDWWEEPEEEEDDEE